MIIRSLRASKLASLLKSGAIGVIPTDTIYGLSASVEKPETIERQKLNELMDEIVSHSSGEFSDRHAVFAVLVNAAFSNDWSLAIRMIERTLGRPAVRRIVKDFPEELKPMNLYQGSARVTNRLLLIY